MEPEKGQERLPDLQWQGAVKLFRNRVFKIRTPQGQGSGFLIGRFGRESELAAIATALHVVGEAKEWEQPIKLLHAESGNEVTIKGGAEPIFIYPQRDLAVIVFKIPDGWDLPPGKINHTPTATKVNDGVDIAWMGFPAIKNDTICFFHGYVSCFLEAEESYLVDGVAINGVSGGPVFMLDSEIEGPENQFVLLGVITAYIANRATGETLPGLSMVTSIAPAIPTIESLQGLSDAVEQANQQEEEIKEAESAGESEE